MPYELGFDVFFRFQDYILYKNNSTKLKLNKSVEVNNILTLKKTENENYNMINNNNDGWFLTSLNVEKPRNNYIVNSLIQKNKEKICNNRNGRLLKILKRKILLMYLKQKEIILMNAFLIIIKTLMLFLILII